MVDLGRGLRNALKKITGAAIVDEKAVKELVKELQRVLISNDVNVKLVFELSKRIEKRALETDQLKGLNTREHVVKVVYEELASLVGTGYAPKLGKQRVLLLGLYGSGKTTVCGKLAHFYKTKGLSVGLICADVDRPAAYEQLEQLAKKVGAGFYGSKGEKDGSRIVAEAMKKAKEDVIIVDSAGRNAFVPELVGELQKINDVLRPDARYLVMSADLGQVAGKQAEEFNKAVGVDGVIVTKFDGSGKGGGALSAVAVSGAKVTFIGHGEKMEDLEVFDPEKFVGRLLGFPDLAALMEKVRTLAEEEGAGLPQEMPEKFTIKTFYEQLRAAKKLGPLRGVFSMLGAPDIPKEMVEQSEDKLKKYEVIINSMTEAEREEVELVKKSNARLQRIAKGSGCKAEDVKELLKQFQQVDKMMGAFKKNRGMRRKIEKMMAGGKLPLAELGQ